MKTYKSLLLLFLLLVLGSGAATAQKPTLSVPFYGLLSYSQNDMNNGWGLGTGIRINNHELMVGYLDGAHVTHAFQGQYRKYFTPRDAVSPFVTAAVVYQEIQRPFDYNRPDWFPRVYNTTYRLGTGADIQLGTPWASLQFEMGAGYARGNDYQQTPETHTPPVKVTGPYIEFYAAAALKINAFTRVPTRKVRPADQKQLKVAVGYEVGQSIFKDRRDPEFNASDRLHILRAEVQPLDWMAIYAGLQIGPETNRLDHTTQHRLNGATFGFNFYSFRQHRWSIFQDLSFVFTSAPDYASGFRSTFNSRLQFGNYVAFRPVPEVELYGGVNLDLGNGDVRPGAGIKVYPGQIAQRFR